MSGRPRKKWCPSPASRISMGCGAFPGIPLSEHGRYVVGHMATREKATLRHMRRLPTLKHPRSLVHIVGSQPLTNKHARQSSFAVRLRSLARRPEKHVAHAWSKSGRAVAASPGCGTSPERPLRAASSSRDAVLVGPVIDPLGRARRHGISGTIGGLGTGDTAGDPAIGGASGTAGIQTHR